MECHNYVLDNVFFERKMRSIFLQGKQKDGSRVVRCRSLARRKVHLSGSCRTIFGCSSSFGLQRACIFVTKACTVATCISWLKWIREESLEQVLEFVCAHPPALALRFLGGSLSLVLRCFPQLFPVSSAGLGPVRGLSFRSRSRSGVGSSVSSPFSVP